MIPGYSDLGNASVNSRLCQVESCSSLGNPACQLGRRKIAFSNNKGMGLVTQLIHLMLRNREEAVVSGQLLLVNSVQLWPKDSWEQPTRRNFLFWLITSEGPVYDHMWHILGQDILVVGACGDISLPISSSWLCLLPQFNISGLNTYTIFILVFHWSPLNSFHFFSFIIKNIAFTENPFDLIFILFYSIGAAS